MLVQLCNNYSVSASYTNATSFSSFSKFKIINFLQMAEFIESNRGKTLLVIDNYKFSIGSVNKKNNSTRWRCIKRDCHTKVYTQNQIVVQDCENVSHNHSPYNRSTISRQIVSTLCKRKATDAPSVRPKTIILKEVGENVESLQFNTTDI